MNTELNHVDPISFKDLIARVHLSKDLVTLRTKDSTGPLLWLDQEEARALRDWLNAVLA